MLFFFFDNADIDFEATEFTWKKYLVAEALPITYLVELIDKREFARVILNENLEIFVMHVAELEATKMRIYLSWANQVLSI